MHRVILVSALFSSLLVAACGSSATPATAASSDTNVDSVSGADAGSETAVADTLGSDSTSADTQATDAAAPADTAGPNDTASSTDTAPTGDSIATCSLTPAAASYTATKVSDTTTLTALTWQGSSLAGGATYTKAIKQITMSALTGAGPGKTPPCLQLDISITFSGEPVVGTIYPIGVGANTANVDINDFAGCDVAKMTTWNALMAPKKAGTVKLTEWTGSKISVEFSDVLLPEPKAGAGSFTLSGKFSSDCVK